VMIQSEREQNHENNKLLDSVKGIVFFLIIIRIGMLEQGKMKIRNCWNGDIKL
jgi:hypothetical protein